MPRQTFCTPEVTAIVTQHVAAGMPKRHAYVLAGISETAAKDWIRRGEEGEEPYAAFADALAQARAEHVKMRIARLQTAAADANQGTGDWKAEAWLLERLHPKDFATRTKTELTGLDGGPVQVTGVADLSRLTDDELRAARDLRAKMDGGA